MNKNNFINVVVYQLEKVHTGVIKWIIDTTNSTLSMDDKFTVLKRLYEFCNKTIPYTKNDVHSIICFPEFSFGRKRKIDMVIKVTLITGISKHIVIEMKVDSIPYNEQLDGTFLDFTKEIDCNEENCFMLFLLGSSQVCEAPTSKYFSVCRVDEIIYFFEGLHINDKIYTDWIESLKEEQKRADEIITYLNEVDEIWNKDFWMKKGYRIWFSLFYHLYNQLKSFSKEPDDWQIYSGSNNPVMNWTPGWKTVSYMDKSLMFYWEFNYEEFVLKTKINQENSISKDDLTQLRNSIANICDSVKTVKGRKTRNTSGTYISLYKWKFNFKEQNFSDIMVSIEHIFKKIPPSLNYL